MAAVFDLILPPRCLVSGEEVERTNMVSPLVWEQLEFISAPLCACCGIPFSYENDVRGVLCVSCISERPSYDMARTALVYNDMSRNLILKFKSADQMQAAHIFVPWLIVAGAEFIDEADYIIPVPLHRWRLFKRRYNQAAILAQSLSASSHIPVLLNTLKRMRRTAVQGSKACKSRQHNVRGAFEVFNPDKIKLCGKTVILVDDVYTSGSTVKECAKTLKKAGVKQVFVLTVARTVYQ